MKKKSYPLKHKSVCINFQALMKAAIYSLLALIHSKGQQRQSGIIHYTRSNTNTGEPLHGRYINHVWHVNVTSQLYEWNSVGV